MAQPVHSYKVVLKLLNLHALCLPACLLAVWVILAAISGYHEPALFNWFTPQLINSGLMVGSRQRCFGCILVL